MAMAWLDKSRRPLEVPNLVGPIKNGLQYLSTTQLNGHISLGFSWFGVILIIKNKSMAGCQDLNGCMS
jgi:hypothetical protein